jgi:hypothetical protein
MRIFSAPNVKYLRQSNIKLENLYIFSILIKVRQLESNLKIFYMNC